MSAGTPWSQFSKYAMLFGIRLASLHTAVSLAVGGGGPGRLLSSLTPMSGDVVANTCSALVGPDGQWISLDSRCLGKVGSAICTSITSPEEYPSSTKLSSPGAGGNSHCVSSDLSSQSTASFPSFKSGSPLGKKNAEAGEGFDSDDSDRGGLGRRPPASNLVAAMFWSERQGRNARCLEGGGDSAGSFPDERGEVGSISSKGFFIRRTERNGERGRTPFSAGGRLICEEACSDFSGGAVLGTKDGEPGRRLVFHDWKDGDRGDVQALWGIGF